MKRLKALEAENAELKRLLAERDLELDVMREVSRKKMVPPGKDAPVIEAMKRLSAQLWDLMACARLELVRRARGGHADHAGVMVESLWGRHEAQSVRLQTLGAPVEVFGRRSADY